MRLTAPLPTTKSLTIKSATARFKSKIFLPIKITILALSVGFVGGCENIDQQMATNAAMEGLQAATVSDSQLKSISQQAAQKMDSKQSIAPPTSDYAQRLKKLVAKHQTLGDLSLNYQVYLSDEINAFAMADGTIRVYSGLMDILTDEELLFVIGHEIGHVALNHSKKQMQLALSTSALRKGTASVGGTIGTIAQSDLAMLGEKVIGAQFSQREEKQSDDYGLSFMQKNNYNSRAAVSALKKLGDSGGGLLSSHPNPQDRAARIADKI